MITTVTLNPCIDRTVLLSGLRVGGHNRVNKTVRDVSGKGINVSVVLQQLGYQTACLGFDYSDGGKAVSDFLAQRQIPYYSVPVQGELRINLKVTDTDANEMTEINEKGNPVHSTAEEELMTKMQEILSITDILVVDGSVPPGVSDSVYRRMIEFAKKKSIRTILDASGVLLKEGLKAAPWLVKPNKFELETLIGEELKTKEDAFRAAHRLLENGVEYVCLSLGKDGAAMISKSETFYSEGIDIRVQGTQGAGDSMVAGICIAAEKNLPPDELLRYGVAAAHGSLILLGTSLCTAEGFEEMLPKIPVHRM